MKKGMNKKGQQIMGLPFSMIFAIFLIIAFIVIAFIAIKYFLTLGGCGGVGLFYDNFQEKINDAWKSQGSEFNYEIDLPSGITRICFGNMSGDINNYEDYGLLQGFDYEDNLFLIPQKEACNMGSKFIEHLNIDEITKTKNPWCVDVSYVLRIKKDFYDKSVRVE